MFLVHVILFVGLCCFVQFDVVVGSTCYYSISSYTVVRTCPGTYDYSYESYCCGSGYSQYCCSYSTKYGSSSSLSSSDDGINWLALYIGCSIAGFVVLVGCFIGGICMCIRGCFGPSNRVTQVGRPVNQGNVVIQQQQQQQQLPMPLQQQPMPLQQQPMPLQQQPIPPQQQPLQQPAPQPTGLNQPPPSYPSGSSDNTYPPPVGGPDQAVYPPPYEGKKKF